MSFLLSSFIKHLIFEGLLKKNKKKYKKLVLKFESKKSLINIAIFIVLKLLLDKVKLSELDKINILYKNLI
jgi:hypothetical protein